MQKLHPFLCDMFCHIFFSAHLQPTSTQGHIPHKTAVLVPPGSCPGSTHGQTMYCTVRVYALCVAYCTTLKKEATISLPTWEFELGVDSIKVATVGTIKSLIQCIHRHLITTTLCIYSSKNSLQLFDGDNSRR